MWRAETLLRRKAEDIGCVVHEVTDEWFLVEDISNFRFDGFSLISKYSVEKRRYNQFDKTFEKIMRNEGLEPQAPPLAIDGEDIDIFTRLAKIDTLISVEADDESRFMIGTIHRVTKHRLFMKHFPANGKWFERPSGIDFAEVGRVCFCDEYAGSWQRYFKSQSDSS